MTNFGDGTISSCAVAASTHSGRKGIRDEAIAGFMYAIDADAPQLFGWMIDDAGALAPIGAGGRAGRANPDGFGALSRRPRGLPDGRA